MCSRGSAQQRFVDSQQHTLSHGLHSLLCKGLWLSGPPPIKPLQTPRCTHYPSHHHVHISYLSCLLSLMARLFSLFVEKVNVILSIADSKCCVFSFRPHEQDYTSCLTRFPCAQQLNAAVFYFAGVSISSSFFS